VHQLEKKGIFDEEDLCSQGPEAEDHRRCCVSDLGVLALLRPMAKGEPAQRAGSLSALADDMKRAAALRRPGPR
jgi:hypothetical protein